MRTTALLLLVSIAASGASCTSSKRGQATVASAAPIPVRTALRIRGMLQLNDVDVVDLAALCADGEARVALRLNWKVGSKQGLCEAVVFGWTRMGGAMVYFPGPVAGEVGGQVRHLPVKSWREPFFSDGLSWDELVDLACGTGPVRDPGLVVTEVRTASITDSDLGVTGMLEAAHEVLCPSAPE